MELPPSSPMPTGLRYRNTVVEYAKHSVYVQDVAGNAIGKVLVIYCGGTIGMRKDDEKGYYPVAGYLSSLLYNNATFNDPEFVKRMETFADNDSDVDLSSMSPLGRVLVLPPSIYGKRIAYQILEYDPLKDSCNMSMTDWINIACDIEKHYSAYDAFVVLHGTDTMAYTASALSFLLENLGKTVIFTGSQIPFCETRNDAKDNLLSALVIAGHYIIPEVCLFFGNKLYRGNRVSKINAVDFEAFDSPNLKPLAKVGVNIEIEWAEVLRPTEIAPFRAHKELDPNVASLRLFPGITESSIKAFFSGKNIKGVVLETFGTGNAPDNRPEIIKVIAEAVNNGVVVVNITQCHKGGVSGVYSTAHSLLAAGVVSGHDMTAECALTKLSYLLSLPTNTPKKIGQLMTESLRGELSTPIVHRTSANQNNQTSWLSSVFHAAVLAASQGQRMAVDRTLRPLLLHHAASRGDLDALRELCKTDMHINTVDYDGRSCLHVAVTCSQLEAVEWLLRHGANIHLRDCHGRTALVDALEKFKFNRDDTSKRLIEMLRSTGAAIQSTHRRAFDEALHAARSGDVEFLKILCMVGLDLAKVTDPESRNILHYAMIHKRDDVIDFLKERPEIFKELSHSKDILQMEPADYCRSI